MAQENLKNRVSLAFKELSMLTGKTSKDMSYLYYLLLRDGTYFDKKEKKYEIPKEETTVESLEDWFNNLGGDL